MSELHDLISAELAQSVDARVADMGAAIATAHKDAARGVLFYGSCLREQKLDGMMLDFYLIVSNYRSAYRKRWLAVANNLVPPNVFPFVHNGLTSKYAVLSEMDFARECSPRARSTSVYARFAQPARLVWCADEMARASITDGVTAALVTLLRQAQATITTPDSADPLPIWRAAFTLTYDAELRAERSSRPAAIVDIDPERYSRLARAAGATRWPVPDEKGRMLARRRWRRLARKGKLLSVLRLAKASFTFVGGIDYLAWKINRHAGTQIVLKPWQRRWPLAAALILLPRLLARGAIR